MTRLRKSIILGLLTGVLGGVLMLMPFGSALEERFGMNWLFQLRGPVSPPQSVVIVGIDHQSSRRLDQPTKIRDWDRSVHAHLIERLVELGAVTIVFDIYFADPRPGQDETLARVAARSKRVVLVQEMNRERAKTLIINTLTSPTPLLAKEVAGLAPFPLPKIPNQISQFWTFYQPVGAPTLPVVALQIAAQNQVGYQRFRQLLVDVSFPALKDLPIIANDPKRLRELMNLLRKELKNNHQLGDELILAIRKLPDTLITEPARKTLITLFKTYTEESSRFLNFYGPPGTIEHLSYESLLNDYENVAEKLNLRNKIVFVGALAMSPINQTDGFYTVFTSDDGVDLSGVEIAATAFANLLERRSIFPINIIGRFVICLLFGACIGFLSYYLSGMWAVTISISLSAIYLGLAVYIFARLNAWGPVFTPMALQLPGALISGLFWQYLSARRARDRYSRTLRYYVPEQEADRLGTKGELSTTPELTYGTCLSSDIAGYTKLSEKIAPDDLVKLTNEYFGLIGERIRARQGQMLDIVGDGMTSVWSADDTDPQIRLHACQAALEIMKDIDEFNARHPGFELPTRIGLDSGWVALANVGGGGHFRYSIVGDIANTTSRIEGLNKHLGTRLLAAEPVVEGLDVLLIRPVGRFVFQGKTEVVSVFEIRSLKKDASSKDIELYDQFKDGFDIFLGGLWQQAEKIFSTILIQNPDDGPSRFYAERSRLNLMDPPTDNDPAIKLASK